MPHAVRASCASIILAGTLLASGCASTPLGMETDREYARATAPLKYCITGSRVCRPAKTPGVRPETPHRVFTIVADPGVGDHVDVVRQLPFVH